LPFGSGGSDSSPAKAHLPHVSTLSRPGASPVSGQLYGTASGGLAIVIPLSCRLSATGICFLGILSHQGVKPPCGRLTGSPGGAPDPDGVSMFRTHEKRLGLGVLCTPETTVSTRSSDVLDRRPPHYSGMSLSPRHRYPSQGVTITRHQQGFTVVHPLPSLPFACDSQTERESLGFPLSFTPGRAGPSRACQGRDRP
jgi:hypothetical protein